MIYFISNKIKGVIMKTLLKTVLTIMIALGFTTSVASANVAKGQKLFQKKLQKVCGFNGAKMATKHTQDEWEKIYEDGKLNEEIKKHCGSETKERFLPHLYDFFYEYASDSGNVPSC
jgi:hypothetical protein